MRIGMILDAVYPPDPRVENEAVSLINSGHEVFLFCLNDGNQKIEEDVYGIQVKRYTSNKLEYKLSALVYTLPFYSMLMSKKIKNFILKNKIEALHIHDLQITEAVFKANKNFNLPTVLDLHENRPEIMKFYGHLQKFPGKYLIKPSAWKKKEEFYSEKANKVILVTEQAKQDMMSRTGVVAEKIVIVPNTVRASFFKDFDLKKEITEKYKDRFVLLYIGDTALRRGLETAIEAVEKLKKDIKNIKLVIVGKSKTDTILKQKVKSLDIEEYVDFEGWQHTSLFVSYIKSSSVCISPLHRNVHHDTTYANKLFQYMSFAKPVLVSNATAQKELIENVDGGLVHLDRNVEDFTEKTLQLANNTAWSEQKGKNGKAFVREEFVWEETSKKLIDLYHNL